MSKCNHENLTIDCYCNDCGYDLIVDDREDAIRQREQGRIIKLLEAFDTCYCAEDDPNPKHYRCGTNQGLIPQEIIALIKGEK